MKILNVLILAAGLIFTTPTVTAQKIGLRAGANFASVSSGNLQDVGKITNYYVGVSKEIPLVSGILFVQPEIQFSKQGFSTQTNDVNLNYINVPVLAKVFILKLISVETGPQFGFKISGDNSQDLNVNTFDKAWATGLSFNFPFGLSIDARYIGSLNEVAEGTNSKNKVVQAGLGFKF